MPLSGARQFEMLSDHMNDGSKNSIACRDIITGILVELDQWAVDFLGPDRKLPHYVVRVEGGELVCAVRGYDANATCLEVYSLNPDKVRYPERLIYLDDIVEMYYAKRITRDCRIQEESEVRVREIVREAQKPVERPKNWFESNTPSPNAQKILIAGQVNALNDALGTEGVIDSFELAVQSIYWGMQEGACPREAARGMANLNEIQAFVLRTFRHHERAEYFYKLLGKRA